MGVKFDEALESPTGRDSALFEVISPVRQVVWSASSSAGFWKAPSPLIKIYPLISDLSLSQFVNHTTYFQSLWRYPTSVESISQGILASN